MTDHFILACRKAYDCDYNCIKYLRESSRDTVVLIHYTYGLWCISCGHSREDIYTMRHQDYNGSVCGGFALCQDCYEALIISHENVSTNNDFKASLDRLIETLKQTKRGK